jgi:hypothetical protein
LYLNRGNFTFEEVAAAWGVADANKTIDESSANPFIPPKLKSASSLFPLFFDFNNDARPDLYIAGLGCTKLYRNDGDKFTDVSATSGLSDCKNSQSAVPLDYTRDGFVDVYVLRYFAARNLFTTSEDEVWINSSFDADNGGVNTVYKNNGDGTFTDVTAMVGGADGHWGLDAAAGDFNGDGGLGVLISNDFGPDTYYKIVDGKFIDASSEALGEPDRRVGMGVSVGYLDDDMRPSIHVSNGYYPQYRHEGNFLWHFNPGGSAVDRAMERGSNYCLWAWGSVFADLDLDGNQDLYVTNGFISGTEKKERVPGVFLEPGASLGDAAFRMGTLQGLPGAVMSHGSIFAGLFKNDAEVGKLSFAGHQRDCMFLNSGEKFVDVASFAGIESEWDGRAAITADFDNNGALDVVVTTRNKGIKILRNLVPSDTHWIGLELVDRKGNHSAPGTFVRATQGARHFARYSTGGKSGFMGVSDPRIHFGLPTGGSVGLQIRWASGTQQSLENLEPGRYHKIVEHE